MKELLKLAREALNAHFENRQIAVPENIKKKYGKKQACFVTLTENKKLRGCIGSLAAYQKLWGDVIDNTLKSAFHDSRFYPLTREELGRIKIEISVLSIPEKIAYLNEDELENKIKDKGVIIRKGFNSATYLPQVWEELGDSNEFLGSLCVKAGLLEDAWKTEKLEVWVYTVKRIEES